MRKTVLFGLWMVVIMASSAFCAEMDKAFALGTREARVEKDGTILIMNGNTEQLRFGLAFFSPNWTIRRQDISIDVEHLPSEEGVLHLKGKISGRNNVGFLGFEQKVLAVDDGIRVEYTMKAGKDLEFQSEQLPFLSFILNEAIFADKDIVIGNLAKTMRMPANSKYAWGEHLVLTPANLKVEFAEKVSLSSWTGFNLRARCVAADDEKWQIALVISAQD